MFLNPEMCVSYKNKTCILVLVSKFHKLPISSHSSNSVVAYVYNKNIIKMCVFIYYNYAPHA